MRIFCDSLFPPPLEEVLRQGCRDHALVVSRNAQADNLNAALGGEAAAAGAEVLFGQPNLEMVEQAPDLRWIHLTSAGYDRYDTPSVRQLLRERSIRLTNSSSVYAVPCAEQAIAGMLLLGRRIDLSMAEQPEAGWPSAEHRVRSSLLEGSRILLLGFGAIGRALVERLGPFGARVTALRRAPQPDDPVRTVDEGALDPYLEQADHVVNLLPGGAPTRHFLSRARLEQMKAGGFLINVGRGTTVDQDALVEVLQRGHLGGAFLDVTDPEPLPKGHALWKAPRCIITPHVAGGYLGEYEALAKHFLRNLARWDRGEPLWDQIL